MVNLPHPFNCLLAALRPHFPASRLICDPLRTIAYGSDASFYRLIPKLVIKASSEAEIKMLLKVTGRHGIAVTFRAAGTSLSGQAISDSVLIIAGANWQEYAILDQGERIRLQPGIIGSQANRYLALYGRKIGPDPASINAAMIGGIAANNASGMCCGTAQNSYQTLSSMRVILHDGTLLDTADSKSRNQFQKSHADLLERISKLAFSVRQDPALTEMIRRKFKIKNTNGYSLNALIDFKDPFEIIEHLLIGSEGTLGFISEIVYNTVVDDPHKASALMIFATIEGACQAAAVLKNGPVAAAELMDRAALRSVEKKKGMPSYLKTLSPQSTALLVESRASSEKELVANVKKVQAALENFELERPIIFTDNAAEYSRLWNIRKGLFPAVGAMRQTGTTVIIEDIAFRIEDLAAATLGLQNILGCHHYDEAIIFGHALDGNLHFVFTQDFNAPREVKRYSALMKDICQMVVGQFNGSLKAEHGTGRNMAPFVEMEWGCKAYALMQEIKSIFDPHGRLNPGVILNSNANIHLQNLKPLPRIHPVVDRCTECGFCESHCPSQNLTLTPRQRIAVQREISRLKARPENCARLKRIVFDYRYQGEDTCAVDGLCELACPVRINTGELTKTLRQLRMQPFAIQKTADWVANHFGLVTRALGLKLKGLNAAHTLFGRRNMQQIARSLHHSSAKRLPLWNPYMPMCAAKITMPRPSPSGPKVVYFPSCISRTMGPAKGDPDAESLPAVTLRILTRAGYNIIFAPHMETLCCGTAFETKGFPDQAERKSRELERALLKASNGGRYPILCDTSPCLYRMQKVMDSCLQIFDPAVFALTFLVPRLRFNSMSETVALHATCSSRKMELEDALLSLMKRCAREVIVPKNVGCCGFAGDRGFYFPELNHSALSGLKAELGGRCNAGYATSRTCEIGLSLHSGIYYKSIFYLIERCTRSAT